MCAGVFGELQVLTRDRNGECPMLPQLLGLSGLQVTSSPRVGAKLLPRGCQGFCATVWHTQQSAWHIEPGQRGDESSHMKNPEKREKKSFMRAWIWRGLVLTSDLG